MTIPVTDPYYRVEVDAGPYSWVTEKGDPPGYGLADPLRVGWSLPNGNPLFHAQPDPMTASFSVVAATMADIANLGRGAQVVIKVYGWPPGTPNPHVYTGGTGFIPDDPDPVNYPPIVLFRGRVADVRAEPHKLGMVATYTCVDYTVDLAEPTIGAGDWPAETNDPRLTRMFNEAGVPTPPEIFLDGDGNKIYFNIGFGLIARPASPTDARSLIWQLVDWVTAGPDDSFGIYHYMRTRYLDELADAAPDPAAPYAAPWTQSRLNTGDAGDPPRLPGVLAVTSPGKYGVDIVEDADRRCAIINADHVDFDAVWSQTKSTDPDQITLTGAFLDDGTTYPSLTFALPDAVPVAASFQMDATSASLAEDFARANLVGHDSDHWTADTFTWYADQDPWPLIADGLWFIEGLHVLANRSPVVLDGVDPDKNPSGLDWYAGRLRSAMFTLARGRYSVDFDLGRQLLRPQVFDAALPGEGTATLAWTDLAAAPYAALDWGDLDPFTWFDYRLLRSN